MSTEKTHKTTAAHFQAFKETAQKFIELLGLKDWEIVIEHKSCEDGILASAVPICLDGKMYRLILAKNWGKMEPTYEEIRVVAIHEVLHVLLSDITEGVDILLDDTPRATKRNIREMYAHGVINRLLPLLMRLETK